MQEDRKKIFEDYKGLKATIKHPFLSYDRYHEANIVSNALYNMRMPQDQLHILDFGCGVGDYGITFSRKGSYVRYYDLGEYPDFVKYRLELEFLDRFEIYTAPTDLTKLINGNDLVIFGEVLEHLTNPLEVLGLCLSLRVPYIFTSSYPCRGEDKVYFSRRGHTLEAFDQQEGCARLLVRNYNPVRFDGEARLWTIK